MNFNYFFMNELSKDIISANELDNLMEILKSPDTGSIDMIHINRINATIRVDSSLNLIVTTPIVDVIDISYEPVQAAVSALKNSIESLPEIKLINSGLIIYKDHELKPYNTIEIMIVYCTIPNIVNFHQVSNHIVIKNFEEYYPEECLESINYLANCLGELSIKSPSSSLINIDGKIHKTTDIFNSQWIVSVKNPTDEELIDAMDNKIDELFV